jgi:aspartyl-tRNA(Asn)/glutamyl-tRNA(Gln) amidotransferase subunit B
MRNKEDAQDYRYFPDPDLPPLTIDDGWVQRVFTELPELPDALRARLMTEHRLGAYDAAQLTASRALYDYYDLTVKLLPAEDAAPRKLVANWVLGEVAAALNRTDASIAEAPVQPTELAGLLRRIADQSLSGKMAKDVFDALWAREASGADAADAIIAHRGLRQISDAGAIDRLVDDVVAANPATVAEFRAGKEKAFNALVGQVMKASQGKANPAQVNAALRRKLAG